MTAGPTLAEVFAREEATPPPAPRKQGPKKRRARPRNLTLTVDASARLDALAKEPGASSRAAIASAAILAYEPPER